MPEGSTFIIIMFFFFVLLIIGTMKKWKFLVDPPEEWARFYSHSALKLWLGSDFLVGLNYTIGIIGSILSMYFMYYLFSK